MSDAAKQTMDAITNAATSAVGKIVLKGMAEGATKAIGDAAEGAGDTAKGATDSIKGLFGK
jgi:glutamate synthase domain-containing protein 3